jgi:hypothetical protein
MAGATTFPGSVDNFAEASPAQTGDQDATSRTHAKRHDDMETAMEAVQGWVLGAEAMLANQIFS